MGFSGTFSGAGFVPVPGAARSESFIYGMVSVQTSINFVDLVKLGPKALPFLLAAVDDKTPTKLTITLPFPHQGAMNFAHELRGNPSVTRERNVIMSRTRGMEPGELESYQIKIGDICFCIIGQIVNRPYQAIRYQPTACEVINSPTQDPILAQEVREIWSATNSVRLLWDSLLTDFVTEKISFTNEETMDTSRLYVWPVDLQSGAAMRLLYYFPKASVELIVARLVELNKAEAKGESDAPTSVADLVKAVDWSDEPSLRREFEKLFRQTEDAGALLAVADAVGQSDSNAMRERMLKLITALPPSEDTPVGDGYHLLYAYGTRFSASAESVFTNYLHNASPQRCESMARLFQHLELDRHVTVEIMVPMLNDKRPLHGQTFENGAAPDDPPPYRVCDYAAWIIANKFSKTSFASGSYAERDLLIKRMREQLAKGKF